MGGTKTLEACAAKLLSATERLHRAMTGDAPTEEIEAAWSARADAFEALRIAVGSRDRMAVESNDGAAVESGDRVGPTVRACLDRVRALDGELIGHGAEKASGIQSERHALGRKRAAIQAHATRERPEPRAVVVKA